MMVKKFFMSVFIISSTVLQAAQVPAQEEYWEPKVLASMDDKEETTLCSICKRTEINTSNDGWYECTHSEHHIMCAECYKTCANDQCSRVHQKFSYEIANELRENIFKTAESCSLYDLYGIMQQVYPIMTGKEITTTEYITEMIDSDGNTLLMKALQNSHDACKDYCKSICNIPDTFTIRIEDVDDKSIETQELELASYPSHMDSCKSEFTSYVTHLIEYSTHEQLMKTNKKGENALLIAVKNGHYEIAQTLIEIDVIDRVITLASGHLTKKQKQEHYPDLEILKKLLKRGLYEDTQIIECIKILKCPSDTLNNISCILKNNITTSLKNYLNNIDREHDRQDMTKLCTHIKLRKLLLKAIESDDYKLVERVLIIWPQILSKNIIEFSLQGIISFKMLSNIFQSQEMDPVVGGNHVLFENFVVLAVEKDRSRIARLLGINTQDKFGITPLMTMIRNVHAPDLGLIQKFLNLGSDINACDNKGYTLLTYAMMGGDNFNFFLYLLKQGADVNKRNNDGETVLMQACKKKLYSNIFVRILLNNGANIDIKNNKGKTALQIAHETFPTIRECKGENHLKSAIQSLRLKKFKNAVWNTSSFLYDTYLQSYGVRSLIK